MFEEKCDVSNTLELTLKAEDMRHSGSEREIHAQKVRREKKKMSMSSSLHQPSKVRVRELEKSGSIALTVTDDERNEVTVFFNSIDDLVNLTTAIRKGGTYGIEYDIQTGKSSVELSGVKTISEYFNN
jgi:hypothetical protein